MGNHHKIEDVRVEQDMLSLMVDGALIRKALADISPLLARATKEEAGTFEVSPSGYGIHWPLIDEDLSIDGLLGLVHTPQPWQESA